MLVCLVLSIPACATGDDKGPDGIQPLDRAVLAVHGQTLVLPVSVTGPLPTGRIPVYLMDGAESQRIEGSLFWIGESLPPHPESGGWDARGATGFNPTQHWTGLAAVWSATPATASTRPTSAGAWVVVAPMPATSTASSIRIGPNAAPLRWIAPSAVAADEPARNPPLDAAQSPWLIDAIEFERASPLSRWRAELIESNLSLPSADGPFADPVLEHVANQTRARWSAAIGRIERADPPLASRLRWRLGAVVSMGGGVVAPAWPASSTVLQTLIYDAADPSLGETEVARRTHAWLELQPEALAWVVSDGVGSGAGVAGPGEGGGVAVANLRNRPLLVSVGSADAPSTDLTTVPSLGSVRLPIPFVQATPADDAPGELVLPRGPESPSARPYSLTIIAGDTRFQRTVPAAPLPARPPGLTLGPWRPDWTMSSWISVASQPTDDGADVLPDARVGADWYTGALLQQSDAAAGMLRGALGPGVGPDALGDARWVLYVECRTGSSGRSAAGPATNAPPTAPATSRSRVPQPGTVVRADLVEAISVEPAATAAATVPPGEELRIWFGPFQAPTLVIRITPDGAVYDETRPSVSTGRARPIGAVPTTSRPDRWTCFVPIPPACIERGDLLRLGLERTDARSVRTSWPRRMMPWQREPGRGAIDLSAWTQPGPPR